MLTNYQFLLKFLAVPQGKKLYKLRPVYSEGNFADLKSHQEFHKSRKIGFDKVDIDLKLEAIVINIKK